MFILALEDPVSKFFPGSRVSIQEGWARARSPVYRRESVITLVMRQGRVLCIERALLDAQQSLGGVARHPRALERRRIVPPLQRR